jgi:anti-repressor protein
MSKTINGEKARNYFIKIEKIAKNQIAIKQETPSYQIEDPIARAEAWITEKKHTLALETKIKEDKSKVEFAETLLDTTNAIDMATCAKAMHLNIGRNKLFSFLREKKVLNSRNIPYQTQIDAGRFVVLESSFVHPKTGDNILTTKTLVTAKGQEYINRLLKDY